PSDLVTSVDPGPREAQQFFEKNKHLYAALKDIEELHEDIVEGYDHEVAKRSGMDLGLSDDEEPRKLDEAALESKFQDTLTRARKATRGMDGYYIGEEGHLAAIIIRTTLPSMDERAFVLQKRIKKLVKEGKY